VLGVVAVGLALLRAIDPAETDAFSLLVVEDFDRVAVNYPDYSSGEVGGKSVEGAEKPCNKESLGKNFSEGRRKGDRLLFWQGAGRENRDILFFAFGVRMTSPLKVG
jgi:hypothetical protein